ncbi:replication initiation protein [Paracraurococcus lichenis]|uniref:Replication protein RepA n=1 Tax=Paracraurococcus lichenis TaxID=3064888 RepID=A0ABT9E8M8_9PROT|nr:replication protein RepA [Paracraurococcus sp. LOR1-02]MDO9712539.1 replication protein RepA [Paracraurococcus sp. LOR1-02]
MPVEEAAIRRISNNSVALDLYDWLAYRLHALAKSTPVPWAALKAQFGAGCTRMDNFRPTFLENLRLALAVYRHAKVEVIERGLLLHPSHPPVPLRPVSLVAGRPIGTKPARPAVLSDLERGGRQEGRHEGN